VVGGDPPTGKTAPYQSSLNNINAACPVTAGSQAGVGAQAPPIRYSALVPDQPTTRAENREPCAVSGTETLGPLFQHELTDDEANWQLVVPRKERGDMRRYMARGTPTVAQAVCDTQTLPTRSSSASGSKTNRSKRSDRHTGDLRCDPPRLVTPVTRSVAFSTPGSRPRCHRGGRPVRQSRRPTFVMLTPARGAAPIFLSSWESEAAKIIVWAAVLPSVSQAYAKLKEILPRQLFSEVAKVRQYGIGTARRIEIFVLSHDTRTAVYDALKVRPLDLPYGRVTLGRDRKTRRSSAPTTSARGDHSSSPTRNRYSVLGSSLADGPVLDKSFRMGILNLNGLAPLFSVLWERASNVRPDVLAVVETYRMESHGNFVLKGYKFIENRMRQGTRRGVSVDEDSHGVGFFVRNEWVAAVKPLDNAPSYKDCLWIRVSKDTVLNMPIVTADYKSHVAASVASELWIGVYYLAPRLNEDALRLAVQGMSETAERAQLAGAECMIVGDLNCCLRSSDDPLRTGNSGVSLREHLLTEMLNLASLSSLHVLCPQDPLFTVTRKGTGRTMRDYIIVPKASLEHWRKPRVHCEVDLDSDHWLLQARRMMILRQALPAADLTDDGLEQVSQGQRPNLHRGWKTRSLLSGNMDSRNNAAAEAASKLRDSLLAYGVIETSPDSSSAGVNLEETPHTTSLLSSVGQELDPDATRGVTPDDCEPGNQRRVKGVKPVDYASWLDLVCKSLDETLGVNSAQRRRKAPAFLNRETWACIVSRRKAYSAVRRAVCRAASQEEIAELWNKFLEHRRTSHSLVDGSKKQAWERFVTELNESPKGGREQWKRLERLQGSATVTKWGAVRDRRGNLVDPHSVGYLSRWREYYAELGRVSEDVQPSMQAQVDAAMNDPLFFQDLSRGDAGRLLQLNDELRIDEVANCLRSLPNHKAVGTDGFSNEVLKALGPEALIGVLSLLWDEEHCPADWQLAIIHPLPKLGDRADLGNTRGISLLSCLAKLYEGILNARLKQFLMEENKLTPEQGGFRPHRECTEQAIVLHQALWRRKVSGVSTYVGFIDFAKAFDRVWRKGLLWKLHALGVRGKMLRVIANLYSSTEACVRVNNACTNTFSVDRGVRQGGVLSPLLFLVFINDILDRMKEANLGIRTPGLVRDSPWTMTPRLAGLLWADDVVLLADSPEDLSRMFEMVDQWCSEWGMEVNAKKSNVMVVSPNPALGFTELSEWAARTPFTLGGGVVELTRRYKYLGIHFQDDLEWSAALADRLEATRKAIFAKSAVLRNGDIDYDVRRRYFDATIMSVALWGAELWASDRKQCARMERCLAPALRMILQLPGKAARSAMAWELGIVPICLRVAARRTRLYLKWKQEDSSIDKSNRLPRRLLASEKAVQTHQWSWFRHTRLMATWIGIPEDHLVIRQGGNSPVDIGARMRDSSLEFYRKWASSKPAATRILLGKLHEEEQGLFLAEYLRYSTNGRATRVLTMVRLGALYLNDRVHKFAPERTMFCPNCPGMCKETLEHFLVECPALESFRDLWASAWGMVKADLFMREPNLYWVALGKSPQAVDADVGTAKACERSRIHCLWRMWRDRCAAQARISRRTATSEFIPGVESQ